MTGSFCTFKKAFDAWRSLKNAGFEILEHYTQEGWNCYKTKEKK